MDELIDLLEKVKLLCAHFQTIGKRREIDCRSQKGWNDQEIIFLGNEHCEWVREREKGGKMPSLFVWIVSKVTIVIFKMLPVFWSNGHSTRPDQSGFELSIVDITVPRLMDASNPHYITLLGWQRRHLTLPPLPTVQIKTSRGKKWMLL